MKEANISALGTGQVELGLADIVVDALSTNVFQLIGSLGDCVVTALPPAQVLDDLRGALVDSIREGFGGEFDGIRVSSLLLKCGDLRVDRARQMVVLRVQCYRGFDWVICQLYELGNGL
ncbi:hypothetical protein D3C77_328100 [compost metagenome]